MASNGLGHQVLASEKGLLKPCDDYLGKTPHRPARHLERHRTIAMMVSYEHPHPRKHN